MECAGQAGDVAAQPAYYTPTAKRFQAKVWCADEAAYIHMHVTIQRSSSSGAPGAKRARVMHKYTMTSINAPPRLAFTNASAREALRMLGKHSSANFCTAAHVQLPGGKWTRLAEAQRLAKLGGGADSGSDAPPRPTTQQLLALQMPLQQQQRQQQQQQQQQEEVNTGVQQQRRQFAPELRIDQLNNASPLSAQTQCEQQQAVLQPQHLKELLGLCSGQELLHLDQQLEQLKRRQQEVQLQGRCGDGAGHMHAPEQPAVVPTAPAPAQHATGEQAAALLRPQPPAPQPRTTGLWQPAVASSQPAPLTLQRSQQLDIGSLARGLCQALGPPQLQLHPGVSLKELTPVQQLELAQQLGLAQLQLLHQQEQEEEDREVAGDGDDAMLDCLLLTAAAQMRGPASAGGGGSSAGAAGAGSGGSLDEELMRALTTTDRDTLMREALESAERQMRASMAVRVEARMASLRRRLEARLACPDTP